MKLAKVNKVFLTGTGAEEHAGLSGLILTLSALGSPVLEVFGPTGVDKLVVRQVSKVFKSKKISRQGLINLHQGVIFPQTAVYSAPAQAVDEVHQCDRG